MTTAPKTKSLHLPLTRVKTIMKSSPDAESVSFDASYFVAKSAELFVTYLTKEAYKSGKKELDYKDIAEVVQNRDTLDFLWELMPKKITVKQYKEIMAKKAASDVESISSLDDDDDSDSEESDSEE